MSVSRRVALTTGALGAALVLAACSSSSGSGQESIASPLGLGEPSTATGLPTPTPSKFPNPNFTMRTRAGGPARVGRGGIAADRKPFQWVFDKPEKAATWCQLIDTPNDQAQDRWRCDPKDARVLDAKRSYQFHLIVGPHSTCTPDGNGYRCRGINLRVGSTPVPPAFTQYTVDYKDGKFTPEPN